ncbi:fimbrial protein [Paenalcaligenes sp. Me131]|uniref:fimbrial protein n=1 Tax=Paenalcaligenes sp. Me131 TaxID=3392636 RepID=UPI003D28EDF6
MIKKLSTFAAVLYGCLLSTSAYADTTNITITGSVRAPTCTAVTANGGQAVSFGSVDSRQLRRDGFTRPVVFYIVLENCTTDIYKNASFKFDATTVTGSSDYHIALRNIPNSAQGVAIALKDGQNRDIRFDNQSPFNYPITNGNNSLKFEASLVATDTDWSTLVPGKISAQATFTVSYL